MSSFKRFPGDSNKHFDVKIVEESIKKPFRDFLRERKRVGGGRE